MHVLLKKNTNQALGLAQYAKNFLSRGSPSLQVLERTKLFHTDSVICGLSALALKTNSPTVLKAEAMQYQKKQFSSERQVNNFARCFGSSNLCLDTKVIAANCNAVREWDSNGTVFGYRAEDPSFQAGEFGHNDYYPVVLAASFANSKINGAKALRAMVLQDEIRGRLAESFSLKTYKVDHVVHGAIASLVTYGALLGATEEQIESGIGMFVAHHIPFRAIRAGHQLSDSKGASAGISTEAAIQCMKRSMMGFVGPKDIFRNPEAIFRLFTKTTEYECPFDIKLGKKGDDFAIMGNHFKLGIYEHQSAGALHGLLQILFDNQTMNWNDVNMIEKIKIKIYEPAYGIICDPHKKNPQTRQSADHSMLYILSTLLRKALESDGLFNDVHNMNDLWKKLILMPDDYSFEAIRNERTRELMEKIELEYGGEEFDQKYPDGIPTQIKLQANGQEFDSGLVMYPYGHARNAECDLEGILNNKFNKYGLLALQEDNLSKLLENLSNIENLNNTQLRQLYDCDIQYSSKSIDDA